MPIGLTLVTPPALEPVSLAEAKLHCRVDHTDEDALITALIVAARQHVENWMGRALINQTWKLTLDEFPCWTIRLNKGRVSSITSVQYDDTAGAVQTVSAAIYRLNTAGEPARLEPKPDQEWPDTYEDAVETVRITYVAGYGTAAADVPQAIREAILLLVGHWYANREAATVGVVATPLQHAVEALLTPYWIGEYGPYGEGCAA